jgi:hypothetical protein
MPRIRSVKPEFWVSESLSRLSRDTRLAFIGLWTCADDEGRFRADPRYLAGQLFPYDSDGLEVIDRALAELNSEGAVLLYEAERSQYGLITGWKRHQRIDKPSASRLPQPPGIKLANIREPSRNPPGAFPEESRRAPGRIGTGNREQGEDQGREQGTGNREQGETSPAPVARKAKKPKQGALPGLPALAEAARPPSRIGKLHALFLDHRQVKLTAPVEAGGLGMEVAPPDEEPDWGRSASTLAAWLKLWPDHPPEKQDQNIEGLMCAWLENSYWASTIRDGKPAVPYPWGAFCAEKQWRKTLEQLLGDDAPATGGVH